MPRACAGRWGDKKSLFIGVGDGLPSLLTEVPGSNRKQLGLAAKMDYFSRFAQSIQMDCSSPLVQNHSLVKAMLIVSRWMVKGKSLTFECLAIIVRDLCCDC